MTTDSFLEQAARELAEFRRRRDAGGLHPESIASDALRAAEALIAHHRQTGASLREAVTLLCEISAHPDPEIAAPGVHALFPALIERLNDSFDPAACALYDQIFAQVIEFYRRRPGAGALDESLRAFGLFDEAGLLARKARLEANFQSSISNLQSSIRKVLLLSRVTLGADVAVTSVMIAKLRDALPGAEFVLLGSRKLRDLFGGDRRIRVREIAYGRGAGVLARLLSWLDVVDAVRAESAGLRPDQVLILDPDSRLTQLGLLPLVRDDRNYFFFESRGFERAGATHIGQLTSRWMNERFGLEGDAFPFVALPPEHRHFGERMAAALRRDSPVSVVTLSFGVGGNESKRLSDEFERALVEHLARGAKLFLDKGATETEREQINRLTASLRGQGRTVVEINEQNAPEIIEKMKRDSIAADAITWDGRIGAFAGLIAASDRYVGYDSAGQHIAAALGVPTRTLFVHSHSARFADRWRPYGPGEIRVRFFQTLEPPGNLREVFDALS
jgi:ADP-heptose:LPS heptosyltransferase